MRSTTKLGSYLDRSIRLRVSSPFAYWFVSNTKLKKHIFLCQHIYYNLEMFRTRLRPTLDYLHLLRDYVLDLFTFTDYVLRMFLQWNLPNAGPYLPRLNVLNLARPMYEIFAYTMIVSGFPCALVFTYTSLATLHSRASVHSPSVFHWHSLLISYISKWKANTHTSIFWVISFPRINTVLTGFFWSLSMLHY